MITKGHIVARKNLIILFKLAVYSSTSAIKLFESSTYIVVFKPKLLL